MALVRPASIAMARNSAPIGIASRSAGPNPSGRRHGHSGEGREMHTPPDGLCRCLSVS